MKMETKIKMKTKATEEEKGEGKEGHSTTKKGLGM